MDLHLAGLTALVTGGSKGIGRAVAEGLAAEGVDLHLAARTESDLEEARDAITGAHQVAVQTHAVDLSDAAARARLIDRVGDVDIVINNAGAIPGGGIEQIDDETWRAAWDLKVFGYINMTRAYYARMKERAKDEATTGGVIINVAGIAGTLSMPGYIAGSSGNAALIAFSRSLGEESITQGVRVLSVNPGPTLTERLIYLTKLRAERQLGDAARWEELDDYRLGRAAEPEEVAHLVVFLASHRASYMSGVSVDVG